MSYMSYMSYMGPAVHAGQDTRVMRRCVGLHARVARTCAYPVMRVLWSEVGRRLVE